jgi:hypothetical protein
LASDTFPGAFTSIQELYGFLYENTSSLSLPEFSRFIASAPSHLPPPALSSLSQLLLDRLLPNSVPRPSTDELTQETLEHCFLPFAAHSSSVEENVKVSLLLETLFRLLVTVTSASTKTHFISIIPSEKLASAIEQGIAAREVKCASKRKKPSAQTSKEEEYRRSYLNPSAARIRFLLQFVQLKASTTGKANA